MPAKDTFFLRKTIDTDQGNFVSGDIDISGYTDPARGRVLVVDRMFCTFMTNGNGPILAADVGVNTMRTVGWQVTTETKTSLVDANENSIISLGSLYVSTNDQTSANAAISMYEEVSAMNPMETTNGFIVPTDKIQCALDVSTAWAGELSLGFVFEVHTEKLSLKRIQELLVSLTAN